MNEVVTSKTEPGKKIERGAAKQAAVFAAEMPYAAKPGAGLRLR